MLTWPSSARADDSAPTSIAQTMRTVRRRCIDDSLSWRSRVFLALTCPAVDQPLRTVAEDSDVRALRFRLGFLLRFLGSLLLRRLLCSLLGGEFGLRLALHVERVRA